MLSELLYTEHVVSCWDFCSQYILLIVSHGIQSLNQITKPGVNIAVQISTSVCLSGAGSSPLNNISLHTLHIVVMFAVHFHPHGLLLTLSPSGELQSKRAVHVWMLQKLKSYLAAACVLVRDVDLSVCLVDFVWGFLPEKDLWRWWSWFTVLHWACLHVLVALALAYCVTLIYQLADFILLAPYTSVLLFLTDFACCGCTVGQLQVLDVSLLLSAEFKVSDIS